ncbi:MAG: hypothetical protein ACR2GU_03700 [Rubrobacteraceae bacterium]
MKVSIKAPIVELSVLRRLGQPGFISEDLERLLAPAYETVSRAALKLGQGEEEDTETEVEAADNAHGAHEDHPKHGGPV